MQKTIYVGNLPFSTSETQVHELFAQYGAVYAVRLITDRSTGKLRGFGFVDMEQAGADAAISALNDTELDGRRLRVNQARERRPQRQRSYW
jgi:RNA recognition motif-containing protein